MLKICWFTADCFVDMDMPIIKLLCNYYEIHWVIQFGSKNRYKESDFDIFDRTSVSVEFVYFIKRARSPLNILDYIRFNKIVNRVHPNIIYSNIPIHSPWQIPFIWALPHNRSIFTAHQGAIHDGMNRHWMWKFVRNCTYKHFKYINMFSKSQASLMHKNYPKPYIFEFALPLKDFGEPTIERPKDGIIRFTSFGRLVHVKRVDLLIEAACNIYERGYKNIRIIIKGACDNWILYQNKIRYPEIFETDIRVIDNSEIPNLFNSTHFFVQPYSVVSQSGPMKIAFRYNVPLITSNLPGFIDEMEENITGFSFESESTKSLEDVLIKSIELYNNNQYNELCNAMQKYVDQHYSETTTIDNYKKMFNQVV